MNGCLRNSVFGLKSLLSQCTVFTVLFFSGGALANDQAAFDPNYESMPLEAFEPMVRKVMERPRNSIYMRDDETSAI